MTEPLLSRPIVPIANVDDAKRTYERLKPHLDPGADRPLVVYVVEKAGGGIDKAPLGSVEALAEDVFERFESLADADGIDVETRRLYGTDVAETIIQTASEVDASAIVFTSRGGGRWLDLVSGGVRSSLVSKADRPVIVLPTE